MYATTQSHLLPVTSQYQYIRHSSTHNQKKFNYIHHHVNYVSARVDRSVDTDLRSRAPHPVRLPDQGKEEKGQS